MGINTTRFALFLCGCVAFLSLYATQGILPQLAQAFGIDVEHATLSITVATLAVALVAPCVGMLTRRLERTRVMAFAAVPLAVPIICAAHAGSFTAFLVYRSATGVVMPILFAVTVSYIAETWKGDSATEMTSFFVSGTTLGGFGGRFIVNGVTALYNWHFALDVLGYVIVVLGMIIHICLAQNGTERSRHAPPEIEVFSLRDLRAVSRNRPVLAAYFVGLCILFSQVTVFTYAGLYLAQPPFRFGTAALGSIYAVFLLSVFVTPLAARLSRRHRSADLQTLAAAFCITGALLTLHPGVHMILLGLAVGACGVFLGQSAACAFVARSAPEARTLAVGLYLSFYYLGGSIGTVLPAPAWRQFGWPGCIALVVAAQLLASIAAQIFWTEAETEAPHTEQSSFTT
jgi:MFS transporter, YNFM family, putative membrane transport protein